MGKPTRLTASGSHGQLSFSLAKELEEKVSGIIYCCFLLLWFKTLGLFFSPFNFLSPFLNSFYGMSLPSRPSVSFQLLFCSTLHPQPVLHMEIPKTLAHTGTHTHCTHTYTRRRREAHVSILDSFLLLLMNCSLVCNIFTSPMPS